MNNLGERLYTLRTSREMSQGDLAEKLDVSRQTISKWENNMSIPELDKIIALSNVFGVSVDYIVKGEGEAISESLTDEIQEKDYEPVAETAPVRMITIDPTKKLMAGLAMGVGMVFLFTIVINTLHFITNAMYGGADEYIIRRVISIGLNAFACASLFSKRLNLLADYYVIISIYSVIFMAIEGGITMDLFYAVSSLLIALLYFKGNKNNSKFLFVFALISLGVAFILQSAGYIDAFTDYGMTIRNMLISLFNTTIDRVPNLVMNIGSAYLMYLRANPKPTYEVPETEYPEHSDMYVGMVKHILLSLFTFGIYSCIWTYKTTENLNSGNNQIQSGTKKLLLCIFVPFYRLYWYYNQAKRLENLMREKDMHTSDFAVVTLILAIFVPIVAASAFLQLKVNEYSTKQ